MTELDVEHLVQPAGGPRLADRGYAGTAVDWTPDY